MPGATEPVQGRCFLAWNETGLIVKRVEEDGTAIEVEFADARRRRLLFKEDGDIVVASLSSAGGVFGGVIADESGRNVG